MSKVLAILMIVVMLSGCGVLAAPFKFFKTHQPDQEQKYNTHEILKREPVISEVRRNWITGNDECVIGDRITHEIITNYEQQQAKLPFWKKIWNLGIGFVVLFAGLTLISFLFPVVGLWMRGSNKFLEGSSKLIVKGVDRALSRLDPESQEKVKQALSETYDSKTKLLVAKLKHTGTGNGS